MIIPSNQIRKSQAQYTKDGVEGNELNSYFKTRSQTQKTHLFILKFFTNLDKSIINH